MLYASHLPQGQPPADEETLAAGDLEAGSTVHIASMASIENPNYWANINEAPESTGKVPVDKMPNVTNELGSTDDLTHELQLVSLFD